MMKRNVIFVAVFMLQFISSNTFNKQSDLTDFSSGVVDMSFDGIIELLRAAKTRGQTIMFDFLKCATIMKK